MLKVLINGMRYPRAEEPVNRSFSDAHGNRPLRSAKAPRVGCRSKGELRAVIGRARIPGR